MKILLDSNLPFDTDELPDIINDMRFWVLEYSDEDNTDYFLKPLLFLEAFNDSKVQLMVNGFPIYLPLEWSVVCGDPELGELEVMPLMSINDRIFKVFSYNPLIGFSPDYVDMEMVNVFPEIKWSTPKMKNGQLLALPYGPKVENPPCIFVTHQKQNKVPEVLDIKRLF